MDKSNQIKVLTDREHVLLRPAMYIGATDITQSEEFVLEDGKNGSSGESK